MPVRFRLVAFAIPNMCCHYCAASVELQFHDKGRGFECCASCRSQGVIAHKCESERFLFFKP
eukprot:SAG31_NODE_33_length_32018_cov_69.763088_6_plen_62_part_00